MQRPVGILQLPEARWIPDSLEPARAQELGLKPGDAALFKDQPAMYQALLAQSVSPMSLNPVAARGRIQLVKFAARHLIRILVFPRSTP